MLAIQTRCTSRYDTHAFVTPDTVDPLADKMIGIVADRRMVLMRRWLGEGRGVVTPDLVVDARVSRICMGPAVQRHPRQSVHIELTMHGRPAMLWGLGFGVPPWCDDESEVAERYWHPEEKGWLGERRDIRRVQLDGWPGQPRRDDRVRIERWNEHGVGEELVAVFDDTDPAQALVDQHHLLPPGQLFDDHTCTNHELHYDHPDHQHDGLCQFRRATPAEELTAVIALLDRQREHPCAS